MSWTESSLKYVDAGVLRVAYRDVGSVDGPVAILLHGFPYDVHAYDTVVENLTSSGCRCIVPYLRGYGPTTFLSPGTVRSGEQAVLGHDLKTLIEALGLNKPVVGGYDWGGRAACVVAALWPELVRGLVTVNGYNVQNIAASSQPAHPEEEYRYWYQYYFHSERGREGLRRNRRELAKLLWRLWSPYWEFDDATFERSAPAFDNPDYVDVVIHSYRHRYALVEGDPQVEHVEAQLAKRPLITVPTVSLDGDGDGVMPSAGARGHKKMFSGPYEFKVLPRIGHNLPQEAPDVFADAIRDVL
ncbi:MAG: alpha/beta hydrolase [Gammaproteobacteria bacterium]|nr:alpha/beta hydrolase [Gammaproteobacteria bacterium]